MLRFTEQLIEHGLSNRVIRDSDVQNLFQGTPARRYGLINKALKKGELIRLCRGVYILATRFRSTPPSQNHIASQLVRPSFISFETSLAYHGWIPERVETVESVIATGRSREFTTPLGLYRYTKMPTKPYNFLSGVARYSNNDQPFLTAKPLRALIDLIYKRKVTDYTLRYLTESLRIELFQLAELTTDDFVDVAAVYKFSIVRNFLEFLQKELGLS